jgi:transcriptional regulator with XRE-family HTH domain
MLSAEQVRGGRAMLRMTVAQLASKAGVAPNTVVRLENGDGVNMRTMKAIQAALEAAGVEFTNGDAPGVRLRKR